MRRRTRQIRLGRLKIGAGSPVSIQSMTKRPTTEIASTVRDIKRLQELGCEVIRVAVKDSVAARAIARIKPKIGIPIEADIHFDHRLALLAMESGADGIRLNPGNISEPVHIKEIIDVARASHIPIRIGVNSGSLPGHSRDQADAMVRLTLGYLKIFQKLKFYDIMISLKASSVATTIAAYRKMAMLCEYPFHLGVTATGADSEGIIKSAIGIGALLSEGIGDTIRVSLTADPAQEVIVARQILQALGIRRFAPEVISCPTCGRCQVDLMKMAKELRDRLSNIRYPLSDGKISTIAIMGCEVNGPGEAKEADIGIAFGKGSGIIFKKSKVIEKVKADQAVRRLMEYIKR